MATEKTETTRKNRGFLGFLRTKGKLWLLAGGATLGVIFLLIGGGKSDKTAVAETQTLADTAQSLAAYEEALYRKLEVLCEAVDGVSDVEVMVSFSSGFRTVYVTDADGKPFAVGSGSSQHAVSETLAPPRVMGVGVVCHGGNRPAVQKALTDLLSTTLGISSNHVYVTGR